MLIQKGKLFYNPKTILKLIMKDKKKIIPT